LIETIKDMSYKIGFEEETQEINFKDSIAEPN
jgi:hypothetical protein